MNDARIGIIIVFPTSKNDAVRKVHILPVHEKLLVQQSHLVQHLLTHQHERTREHLHLMRGMLIEVGQMVAAKPLGAGKEPRKPEDLVERHLGCGQSALALRKKIAFAIDHTDAETTAILMTVHESDALGEGIGLYQCVGVEQQHKLPVGDAHGLVVGPREAHILLVVNEDDRRKTTLHHLHRAVHRVVVHHEDLGLNALACHHHRLETGLQEVLHVVVDNDDRELQDLRGTAGREVAENGSVVPHSVNLRESEGVL